MTAETAAAPAEELSKLELNGAAPTAEVPTTNGGGDEAEGSDEEDGEEGTEGAAVGADKKKKKKKPKKKGKKAATVVQTEPPTIPVSKFFKSGNYPEGETHEYLNDNSFRTTSEEKRHLERLAMSEPSTSAFNYNSIRRAAEVHRQVRKYARKAIKPGMTMTEIAELIENGTRALVEEEGLERGVGFPTGLSRNHCAAHYTPNAGDTTVLKYEDVLKVDFGVQVNGRIVDSAFTLNWEPTYDELLLAAKEATEAGVKEAGIDVRMGDIGRVAQEVMESHEVQIKGKTLPVKSIRNLTGHNINPYQIHGGKSVPIIALAEDDPEANVKMEEGEVFAIEMFGSTGSGRVRDQGICSHYAKIVDAPHVPLRHDGAKKLLNVINKQFGTLPWCKRYLDRIGQSNYDYSLRMLVKEGLVQDYPPLCDVEGSQTAQFEHTILLRPTCKEIVSRGDDY